MTTRSYTNSQGETIEVNQDHLDVAVKIKIELQKMSPSLRCDWKTHKKLMKLEGFDNSDANEAYRCLIKDYQKEVGLLSSLPKHVDMVTTSKLRSLDNLLGELYSEKRENQVILNEINKFKRDFHLSKAIADEIVDVFKEFKVEKLPQFVEDSAVHISDHKAIVVLTDIHVGAVINDVYGNSYNYNIARKRLAIYRDEILDNCKRFGISSVIVAGLGDFVEHVNMRYKQSNETEFKLAQQTVKASELVIGFLSDLNDHLNVEYVGIAGNHDRMQGDKNIAYDDDNANVIINYNVMNYINAKKGSTNGYKLSYIPTLDGATEINLELNGKKIKLVHGHLDEGNKKDRVNSYITMQNEFFDVLVYGHLHHYDVKDLDHGRMTIGVGCLSGRNDYSKHLKCATNASQMMLIVKDDGNIIPIKIDLQYN